MLTFSVASKYASERSGKENYFEISKICYHRCIKIMGKDSLKVKIDLAKKAGSLGCHYLSRPDT